MPTGGAKMLNSETHVPKGVYRLTFDTAAYFMALIQAEGRLILAGLDAELFDEFTRAIGDPCRVDFTRDSWELAEALEQPLRGCRTRASRFARRRGARSCRTSGGPCRGRRR